MDGNIDLAKRNYETFCGMLDEREFHYRKNEEDFSAYLVFQGDDLDMEVLAYFYSPLDLFVIQSVIPVVVPDEKCFEVASAVTYINNCLVDGFFDFDLDTRKIAFKMTTCYADSDLSGAAFDYMRMYLLKVVEDYNDKIFALAKGMINFKQFVDFVNGGAQNG